EAPDARTTSLISLVQACNLLDEVFTPAERPRARQRIVELVKSGPTDDGVFGKGLGAVVLFGLVGGTLYYAYRRLRESFKGRAAPEWDVDILDPWVTVLADS